jgi:hypothetical protein
MQVVHVIGTDARKIASTLAGGDKQAADAAHAALDAAVVKAQQLRSDAKQGLVSAEHAAEEVVGLAKAVMQEMQHLLAPKAGKTVGQTSGQTARAAMSAVAEAAAKVAEAAKADAAEPSAATKAAPVKQAAASASSAADATAANAASDAAAAALEATAAAAAVIAEKGMAMAEKAAATDIEVSCMRSHHSKFRCALDHPRLFYVLVRLMLLWLAA